MYEWVREMARGLVLAFLAAAVHALEDEVLQPGRLLRGADDVLALRHLSVAENSARACWGRVRNKCQGRTKKCTEYIAP